MQQLYSKTFGEGPSLVLLHGWGMNSTVWHALLPDLCQHYQVTLIDLPGFGNSAKVEIAYELPQLATAVLACAPQQAIWIGWSLGGLITTYLAIEYPDRVKALFNIASSPKFIASDDWPGMKIEILDKFANALRENYHKTLQRFLALQFIGVKTGKQQIKTLQQQLSHSPQPSLHGLNQGLSFLKTSDLRSRLTQITCPTIYFLGSLDVLVPKNLESALDITQKNIQTKTLPGAGHMPFLSHPDEFIKTLQVFTYATSY